MTILRKFKKSAPSPFHLAVVKSALFSSPTAAAKLMSALKAMFPGTPIVIVVDDAENELSGAAMRTLAEFAAKGPYKVVRASRITAN